MAEKKYSFIVKDTSEFGSDFEPVKNLSAEEAVKLFQNLNKSDVSKDRFGIALSIPGDKVFDEWTEEGICIAVLNGEQKVDFGIFGNTFITQLNEKNERSRTYIDAYKDLYTAFENSRKENSESYDVVHPDFLFAKENELFVQMEIENNKRTFTVVDSVLSAVDRAEFLANLVHYVNGDKKEKDEYKINDTLNKENLKPFRFIYEGYGYLGESIYESFVCKKNDDSGFKYLMVPHNAEYYKGFDKLIVSEKTYLNIEECQNALINILINQKENHNYKIEIKTNQFYSIPEKYKQPLLSFIEKNEKEICDKTEKFFKTHPEIEKHENIKNNISLYLTRVPDAVDWNSSEWLQKFEKIELSISNPLLENTIEVNKEKDNKLMDNKLSEKTEEQAAENKIKNIEIKPVTLDEILSVMEFTPEFTENGKIKIYDQQRNEYLDNRSDLSSFEEDNWTFSSAAEVFERMEIYINDYYVHDMQEQLYAVGVEITDEETLADLCKLYQSELEKGNDKLSIGELNLAMGIVHPETVILREEVIKQEQSNNKSIQENEIQSEFLLYGDTPDEKIVELKEHLSMNGYDIKWKDKTENNNFTEFTCSIDDKSYIQTILEDRGIDYEYDIGLLSTGYDASWLSEDEILDAEIVTEEEFKRINELREKEFKDLKLPYIKIDFTEGSTSNHKPARMESGTVLGLKEGEELLKELNNRFNIFLKCDVTVHFPDAKDNEPGSYSLRYDFCDDKRTLENGKEVPFEREGLSDYIRMTCSYPEVLEKYEQQWQKVNAPNITEEQKKLVADIVAPNFEKLKERYKEHLVELNSALKNDKELNSGLIINKEFKDASEEAISYWQNSIATSFERYAGRCIGHIADYLDENKNISFKDEFLNYANHQISNMLQDVKYGESRNVKFGEHGYDFDFSLWRKSLENVMDASEYDSFLTERLQAEELRYKEIRNAAKDMGVAKVETFLESPKVFNTPKSLGLLESEQFAYYQYELSLQQIKTIVSADSDIVKKVEENTDSPDHLDVHFVFDREHNKLTDFYIRYKNNNNTYTSSYVAGEVRESDISKDMQENLCKIFEEVFKINQKIHTGAAETQSVNLFDLPAEELRESLKYALNEAAETLPEIDFTRENYNKLFPRDRLKTPIETVKIGAHQFEKLEAKDRKNLLQAVHDVLSEPDLIINEEKESVFGDTEFSHVYAKSYVINEKTKAVQSVVVNIEDEYISISTHKRDISNVVNKIKKPDQLLFAAAKVRLLAEQHTKEKLSQSVVSPNRENEYVIPPQTNIPQSQEKSSDEIMQNSFSIKDEKYSFSDAERLLKEDIASIFEELDSGETEENLTLNGVKVYGNPEKDGKIKLLVEFDSKNPENKWTEDSVFNAIAEENITFNGMEVDVNPITPEKSGTIEEYLSRLERLGAVSEEEAIEKQAELIDSKEKVKKDNQIDVVLEHCNKILDKYNNTHFTELEQRFINELEKDNYRHQILMSLCNMKYVHVTTKDKDGYWEIKKGREISANEARKLMSYDDFASGVDRASFHHTAGRNANDGSFIYFDDSARKRDIQPYELTKEDYEILSRYEEFGGLKENIPESILQQLSQYNISANSENPDILSWQDIEDYFSVRSVKETKNEVLESFTKSNVPTEKELKEECFARLVENQIDFYGFDTNMDDPKFNSEISVAKWNVLEKIAQKAVSKELDLKPYVIIQEEADRLLKENPVFQECIKNGMISVPDTFSTNENSKNIELTAEDIKNAKALLPKEQYQLVLSYTQGEEGEHFKGIIKNIASKAEAIKGKSEILTEDEKHPLAFKYTLGNSSFYVSEWDGNDEFFGYTVFNGDTQNSEWGYTSLKELKNAGSKNRNGFPVMPEMIFYGLEDTIERQISVDYPDLSEKMGFTPKKNHNEKLISEFGKEIFETLETRKLEHNTYNICCAAQFVIRSMDSSESKEIFSIMEKCGCKGKNGKEKTTDFLTEVLNAENNTASAVYDRKRLYEKINKSCEPKSHVKQSQNLSDDYEIEM